MKFHHINFIGVWFVSLWCCVNRGLCNEVFKGHGFQITNEQAVHKRQSHKLLVATWHIPAGLKGNSGIFKPRPYLWHEIRVSTHREQFGESRRPSEAI